LLLVKLIQLVLGVSVNVSITYFGTKEGGLLEVERVERGKLEVKASMPRKLLIVNSAIKLKT